MTVPVVFTQLEIDQMAAKPFDVYDKDIRASMDIHQKRLDAIAERDAERKLTQDKWKKK